MDLNSLKLGINIDERLCVWIVIYYALHGNKTSPLSLSLSVFLLPWIKPVSNSVYLYKVHLHMFFFSIEPWLTFDLLEQNLVLTVKASDIENAPLNTSNPTPSYFLVMFFRTYGLRRYTILPLCLTLDKHDDVIVSMFKQIYIDDNKNCFWVIIIKQNSIVATSVWDRQQLPLNWNAGWRWIQYNGTESELMTWMSFGNP